MSAPCVLVFAGLDPSGAAGLLADAEAVRAAGARPLGVLTALTVQTTRAAITFEPIDPARLTEMAEALLEEENVRAIKIGMVGDARSAAAIAKLLQRRKGLPAVVDPVLRSSSGLSLFKGSLPAAREAYLMLAQGALLTPNISEAELLLDGPADARALLARGAGAVLLKGGHLPGDPVDVLVTRDGEERFSAPRIASKARGTGCRLASAIAAGLAQGTPLRDSVVTAREVVRRHLESHP